MLDAFLDEAGDEKPFGSTPYLAVALLMTSSPLDYARGRTEFYEAIASRIVDEELLQIPLW